MKTYLKKFTASLMSFFIITGVCACKSDSHATNIATQNVYAGLGKATDPIPLVPNVRIGTLPNGLKYYILKNNEPKDEAYLSLVVNAGSVLEKEDEQGSACLVEHIAFKDTEGLSQDILKSCPNKNCHFFSDSSTGFDKTIYNFEVPVQTDKNNVKHIPQKALKLLDNLTHAVTFSQKDLDDQKRILEEKRSRNERSYAFGGHEVGDQTAYPILSKGSPYASRLPIVTQEVIKTATPSKLKDFYNRWYRTDNMALVFVGDFDDSVLEASLASHFHAPAPKTPLQRPIYDLPLPVKGHIDVEILTCPKQNTIKTCLYYRRQPKPIVNNIASCRQYFLDRLIDYMLKERFEKIYFKSSAPCISAYSEHVSFANLSRFYKLIAWVKQDKVEEAIKSILQETERILRYSWTDSEVELAKLYVMSSLEAAAAQKRHESSYSYARSFREHFLARENVITDPDWNLMAAKKMFPKITVKDLTNTARDYFADDDLTVFVLASQKDKLPSKEKICKIVKDVKKSKVSPPVPEIIDYTLVRHEPVPGSILKETIDQETKAVILSLSNGAKVILKQIVKKEDKDSEVSLIALAKGGTMAVIDKKDIISARFASEMFYVSGIGPYSRKETSNKLLGKQVYLQTDIDAFERSFEGYSSLKDIKTLFELIYLRFTSQKFDSNNVKYLIESYKRNAYDHENIFIREINKTFYDDSPHFNVCGSNHHSRFDFLEASAFVPIKFFRVSDYPKINQKTAIEFIRKCFNPSDFTFVFVGNIDTEVFKSYIKTYIASIAPLKTLTNQNFVRPKPSKKEIYTDYEHNSSSVHMSWVIDEKYSLKLKAASKVLEKYISIVFDEPIKDASAWVCLNSLFDELSMDIYVSYDSKRIYNSKRIKERISRVFKDIQNIAEGNIDADILSKAKEATQELYNNVKNYKYDITLAKSYACSAVLHNTELSEFDNFPFVCQAVSRQDLKDIAARLLKGKYYQLILRPKKHKTTK